jgi:hypothetical protein
LNNLFLALQTSGGIGCANRERSKMILAKLLLASVITAAPGAGSSAAAAAPDDHPVLELRQYKIVHGDRDKFIAFFEQKFVESQEDLGLRIIGQFRDARDPDRFTWIRSFDNMTAREKGLNAFYFGPVWKANRDVANPMLDDNDNVLLLRPATPELAFARQARGDVTAPAGVVLANIEYLWKAPDEGFTKFFRDELMPALTAAGIHVIAGYVPEEAENNFPRLPVRREKVFVWFARADSEAALKSALKKLEESKGARPAIERLRDFEEREPQRLWLHPTARSALR